MRWTLAAALSRGLWSVEFATCRESESDTMHATPMLTIVSQVFPPQVSGSAILLANLLAAYPGRVTAISGYHRYAKSDPAFRSPCPVRNLPQPRLFSPIYVRLRNRIPTLIGWSLQRSLEKTFIRLGTTVVLAAYPFAELMVASFLAARKLGLPFYAHMHDLWMENVLSSTKMGRFAEQWEPLVLRESTRVLCMTEAMQSHYATKYGIRTELLPHTVSERDYFNAPQEMRPPRLENPTVLFVGAVDPAFNLDALKVLAAAAELLPADYQLLFCTSSDLDSLQCMGIKSSRLRVLYVSRSEVQKLQSEAHVLIAPLSHKNCSSHEVRTVFSTKLLEYLISGRPIIVFAPEVSFEAESAKKGGWGLVVSDDSPSALAAAIVKITTDQNIAAKLVRGALKEAQNRRAALQAERLHNWTMEDTLKIPAVQFTEQMACIGSHKTQK